MGEIIVAALITSAITAGSAAYQADEQRDTAREEEKKRLNAQKEAEAESKRIALASTPEAEAVGSIEYGVESEIGSTQDFIVNKATTTSAGLMASGGARSGLGYVG